MLEAALSTFRPGKRRQRLERGQKCVPKTHASFRQIAPRGGAALARATLALHLLQPIHAVMDLPKSNLQSHVPLNRAKLVAHPPAPSQQQISSA